MDINFDLVDLQASRAVVELGDPRRAAEAISISQPALSRRVDELGSVLGVPLFERTTHSVTLTTVGRVFVRNVEQPLDGFDVALLGIHDVSSNCFGQVTIACVPSVAYYFLPNPIAGYYRRFPCIRVKPLDVSANGVLGVVINDEANFGSNFMGSQEPEIEFKTLLRKRFVAACRHDRPLTCRKRVTWKEPYVREYVSANKTSDNRLLLDQALLVVTPRAPNVCETWHVTIMLGLVETGLGIATVPSMTVPGHDHPTFTSVPLAKPVAKRRVGIVKQRGRASTPAAEGFHQMIIDVKRSGVAMGDAWLTPFDLPRRCTTSLVRHGTKPG